MKNISTVTMCNIGMVLTGNVGVIITYHKGMWGSLVDTSIRHRRWYDGCPQAESKNKSLLTLLLSSIRASTFSTEVLETRRGNHSGDVSADLLGAKLLLIQV